MADETFKIDRSTNDYQLYLSAILLGMAVAGRGSWQRQAQEAIGGADALVTALNDIEKSGQSPAPPTTPGPTVPTTPTPQNPGPQNPAPTGTSPTPASPKPEEHPAPHPVAGAESVPQAL